MAGSSSVPWGQFKSPSASSPDHLLDTCRRPYQGIHLSLSREHRWRTNKKKTQWKKWKLAPTSSCLSVRGLFVRVGSLLGPGFGPDCCLCVVLRWPTAPGFPCDMKHLSSTANLLAYLLKCTVNSIAFSFWMCLWALKIYFFSYRRSSSTLHSFVSSVTLKTFHSLSDKQT